MAGFFDYLRMLLGWHSAPDNPGGLVCADVTLTERVSATVTLTERVSATVTLSARVTATAAITEC